MTTATASTAAPVSALILAAKEGDYPAAMALLDAMEEAGEANLATALRRRNAEWIARNNPKWLAQVARDIGSGVESHQKALALHKAIARIDLDTILVQRSGRSDRKEIAREFRALLSIFGIKGVSVTTPNYSMARGVEVHYPVRADVVDPENRLDDPCCQANRWCEKRLEEIALRAFPGTHDRSDSSTDYFDCFWSFTGRD